MERVGKSQRITAVILVCLMAIVWIFAGQSESAYAASSGFIARSSSKAMARLEAGAESLKSHSSLTVYNTQGKTTTSYTYTISKSDRKILKSFAKAHFTEDMTVSEKVATTMEWIHTNVTYASSSSLWSKISGKSWVEAIFKDQAGQCAQYNGALACMMAYLGYDIAMVQGYRTSSRGSYWQHFWARVTIDDVNYIVEAGNAGKSGNWYYLCAKYSETKGYVL